MRGNCRWQMDGKWLLIINSGLLYWAACYPMLRLESTLSRWLATGTRGSCPKSTGSSRRGRWWSHEEYGSASLPNQGPLAVGHRTWRGVTLAVWVRASLTHPAFAGKNKSAWPRELCVCWKNYFRKKQIRVGANCFCIVTLSYSGTSSIMLALDW